MTLILIALITLFLSNILFLSLFLKIKEAKKIVDDKLNIAISDLSEKRIGCYNSMKKLSSTKKGPSDDYDCMVHVKEVDRYTNGTSKIELLKIEVISGFDPQQFEYVKGLIKSNFCSIKTTSDIEWLESEESIKKMRKEKLNKLKDV